MKKEVRNIALSERIHQKIFELKRKIRAHSANEVIHRLILMVKRLNLYEELENTHV